MKYTGNYNLKKPDGTDVVNIEDFNENADIIDAELKKLNDAIKDLDADGITLPDGKTISEKFEEIETEIGNIEELDTDTKSNIIAAINEIYQEIVEHKAEMATDTNKPHGLGSIASEDYETGLWTPRIRGTTVAGVNTYSTQVGKYTRIGKSVFVEGFIALSSKDINMAGEIQIAGLPFPLLIESLYRASGAIGLYNNITIPTGYTELSLLGLYSQDYIALRCQGNNINNVGVKAESLSDNSTLIFSVWYRIN